MCGESKFGVLAQLLPIHFKTFSWRHSVLYPFARFLFELVTIKHWDCTELHWAASLTQSRQLQINSLLKMWSGNDVHTLCASFTSALQLMIECRRALIALVQRSQKTTSQSSSRWSVESRNGYQFKSELWWQKWWTFDEFSYLTLHHWKRFGSKTLNDTKTHSTRSKLNKSQKNNHPKLYAAKQIEVRKF